MMLQDSRIRFFAIVLLFSWAGITAMPWRRRVMLRMLDMSYKFNNETIYLPTFPTFKLKRLPDSPKPVTITSNEYSTAEHGGTHMDAPRHIATTPEQAQRQWSIDEIPVSRLFGRAVKIDISKQAAANPDYRLSVADLLDFERKHGQIPEKCIVFMFSDWGKRWPDRKTFLGTEKMDGSGFKDLHYPGFHEEAAKWLVANRKPIGVGSDTPSLDYGQNKAVESHVVFFRENIWALEYVANLDKLPSRGAWIYALPMKIDGGTGAPTRLIAKWFVY